MFIRLTDEEIITVLECCSKENYSCYDCPLLHCGCDERILSTLTLQLFKRQQAEIANLQFQIKKLSSEFLDCL